MNVIASRPFLASCSLALATALAYGCAKGDTSAGFASGDGGSGQGGGSSGGSFGGPPGSGYHGDGGPCVNRQCQQIDCTKQGKAADATTLSGTVYDPAGLNPVYNAIVYVPNEPPKPFSDGVVCDRCSVFTTGNPVVSALSDATGHFELRNVPVGSSVPLVVQIGKWRRQTTIATVSACTDNPIADRDLTRLPRSQSEGDLPQMALATGGCDAFECLLRKIGVADGEFTSDGGPGRVHVYRGLNGMSMYQSSASTALWSDVDQMKKYDLIINSCECSEQGAEKTPAMLQNHANYANAGGRVFDTHYNYYWIDHGPAPLPATAMFAPDSAGPDPTVATIDTSFPKGDAFATWMLATGASTTKGQIPITQAKYDVVSVNAPATRWIYGGSSTGPNVFHYTFNTPVTAPDDKQCGKVLFSDFHAAAGSNMQYVPFPMECNDNPLTAQEAALEFMIFDLSSCVQIDTQPPLPPRTQ
jgi:hypothetical protein